jgi:hypothetical protein
MAQMKSIHHPRMRPFHGQAPPSSQSAHSAPRWYSYSLSTSTSMKAPNGPINRLVIAAGLLGVALVWQPLGSAHRVAFDTGSPASPPLPSPDPG